MKFNITRKRFNNEGVLEDNSKTLVIHIKPGWKEGTKITFVNEGDEDYNLIPGDIIFVIKERNSFYDELNNLKNSNDKSFNELIYKNNIMKNLMLYSLKNSNQNIDNIFVKKYLNLFYTRGEGNNLIYTIPITVLTSFIGGEFNIFTLDNRLITLTVNNVISPYYQKILQCKL